MDIHVNKHLLTAVIIYLLFAIKTLTINKFRSVFFVHKQDNDLIVNLPNYGQLQGSIGYTAWTNRTIFQFLNVPYAESPSGLRRFQAPVPIGPWTGVRDARTFGTQCPRMELLDKIKQQESAHIDVEDCLNMAIYTTSVRQSLRPVMVFIHGGFFVNQGINQYPPNYLLERDIVLAVVGYRIDVFGNEKCFFRGLNLKILRNFRISSLF